MERFETIRKTLGTRILKWEEASPSRLYFDVSPADLADTARYLYLELKLRFIIASGVDTRGGIEILYHFADDASGAVITPRVTLADKKAPKIASLSGLIKGAAWIEREIHELLGVRFEGHPGLAHLLLPNDWPEGEYPLRHDHE